MDCLYLSVLQILSLLAPGVVSGLDAPHRSDGNSFFDLQVALRKSSFEGIAFHGEPSMVPRCLHKRRPLVIKVAEPRGYHALAILEAGRKGWRVFDSRVGESWREPTSIIPTWKATGYQTFMVAKSTDNPAEYFRGCITDVKHALAESYVYQAEELEKAARSFAPADERHGKLLKRAAEFRQHAAADGKSFPTLSW